MLSLISYRQDDKTGELNTSDTQQFIPCIQEVILHTNMSINIVLFHTCRWSDEWVIMPLYKREIGTNMDL